MIRSMVLAVVLLGFGHFSAVAQDPVFSGPQPGEKLGAFKVRGVFDDAAGKEFDYVTDAAGKPIVLILQAGQRMDSRRLWCGLPKTPPRLKTD
jgi:hypothetical protein